MPEISTGMILLWSGSIVSIPPGYVICDGNNDTPDLRDRFILGAGGAWAVDDSGGTTTHTHNFTGDGHFHDLAAGAGLSSGSTRRNFTSINPATGTTDSGNNLPPFYALAFIMKT